MDIFMYHFSLFEHLKILEIEPMNPFNFETKYDDYLADLIAKINKSSIINVNESIKELLTYLPNSNYQSDYQIILKTLKPLFSSPGKNLINKITYFLAKKLGSDCLESIIIEWVYENFDSVDPYAKYIVEKHINFSSITPRCLEFLTWNEYLKDLQFVRFLLLNTSDANTPKSSFNINFDMSKLPLVTYLELDILFDILQELKNRNPIEFMKYSNTEYNSERDVFINQIFDSVKNIKSSILINRKHKILIAIFDFLDDSIYEDAKNLEIDIFIKILDKNIKFEDITVSTVEQLISLLPKVINKDEYILKNINKNMCLFQLLEKLDFLDNLILQNQNSFLEIANENIKRHFIHRICRDNFTNEFYSEKIKIIYDLVTGKNKIIAASILEDKLNPQSFKMSEIEEVMSHSVNVFPVDFFLNSKFNSSAVYLLQKYPDLCSKKHLKNVIESFSKTTPEQIVHLIQDIESLTFYLQDLSPSVIKDLCKLNTSPLLKIVYLFYLRNEIEEFNVDYSIVLEYFLEKSFLIFLLNRNNNINNFLNCCIEFIKNLSIRNTIFYYGYNFDSNSDFYYNLDHTFSIPERNEALSILLSALQECKNVDLMLEVLKNLIQIILYFPCIVSDRLKLKLTEPEFIKNMKENFYLENNNFILERFLLEFTKIEIPEIELSVLEINPLKAVDVIIRNLIIPKEYFTNLNSSYLSNQSLQLVIESILQRDDQKLCLRPNNKIKELESNEKDSKNLTGQSIYSPEQSKTDGIVDSIQKLQINYQDVLVVEQVAENNERNISLSNPRLERFLKKFLKPENSNSVLDFLYLIERDRILTQKNFRSDRFNIYMPLITAAAEVFSESVLNLYSISKPEKAQDSDSVFEMLFSQFKNLKCSFWIILFNTIIKTNNLYLCFFIEERILAYLNIKSNSFLTDNQIMSLDQYLKLCCPQEFTCFGLAFPNIYSKFRIKHSINLEQYVQSIVNMKIDNGKLTYVRTGDSYRIKLNYQADSLLHTAVITIPANYPYSKCKIEFDKDQKNIKFYHKLNEILNRTSKFVEIFFIWKIDIDNRLIGHTECLICYFIMDPKYKQLPSFQCKTCKNIFHEKCIFKWASQSKRAECPFCRSELQIWDKDN